jgi:hypothetical protein
MRRFHYELTDVPVRDHNPKREQSEKQPVQDDGKRIVNVGQSPEERLSTPRPRDNQQQVQERPAKRQDRSTKQPIFRVDCA